MENNDSGEWTNLVLLFSTFTIAVCGLIYELLAGTISSYLLGDTVYQFSIIIGVFMASMGVGSFLSRYLSDNLQEIFIVVQIIVGLIGGFSTLILFFAFSYLDNYSVFLYLISIVIGILIGLEIPIIIRILKIHRVLKLNVSNVLTADYIGALGAAILFPVVLVPQLGLYRTALLFGMMNVFVAGLSIFTFGSGVVRRKQLVATTILAFVLLASGFFYSNSITGFFENRLYTGEIIYTHTTPYQHVVITRNDNAVAMFIDGNLQFNSLDEYRYHEALIHPTMSLIRNKDNILVLGAGDGMAVRELLKYSDVKNITVVDIDPVITELFSQNPLLTCLNNNALNDKKVTVVNDDAWKYLESISTIYNAIIIDLPDPNDIEVSKLYTRSFYKLIATHLAADGIVVTQATSPYYAREVFWCIAHTLEKVTSPTGLDEHLFIKPYHTYIPSFGDWGFIMASPVRMQWQNSEIKVPTRYLDTDMMTSMMAFPPDMSEVDTEINTIQNHKLAYYYEKAWSFWY